MKESDPETAFAIVVDGEAAGGIGFMLHEDVDRASAEIGATGRGVSEAGVHVCRHARMLGAGAYCRRRRG